MMNWQQDEIKKRNDEARSQHDFEEKKEAERLLENKTINRFWSKLIDANSKLPSDLRMPFTENKIHGKTYMLGFHNNLIQATLNDYKYAPTAASIRFDEAKKKLIASYNVYSSGDDYKDEYFELTDSDVETIIKSLCTGGTFPYSGFEHRPKTVVTNIRNQGCLASVVFLSVFGCVVVCFTFRLLF